MKKIFSIVVFAAAFAFAFTSCKKQPQPEPEVPADFKISVSDISALSAIIKVEPLDSGATYYWSICKASQLDSISNDSLVSSILEEWDFYIAFAGAFDYELSYDSFLCKGVQLDTIESLSPKTDYVVFALKANGEGKFDFESMVKKEFKSLEVKPKKTVDLDFHDAVLDDYRKFDGSFQIVAAPADSSLVVYLNPYSDELTGSFKYEDLDPDYSGIEDYVEEAGYYIADAEFSGVANGNAITYSGWFVATNEIKYNFSFNCAGAAANKPAKKVSAKQNILKQAKSQKFQNEKVLKNFRLYK